MHDYPAASFIASLLPVTSTSCFKSKPISSARPRRPYMIWLLLPFPTVPSLLSLHQLTWPHCCLLNMPSMPLPQNLCASLPSAQHTPLPRYRRNSLLISFRSQRSYPGREVFLDYPISNFNFLSLPICVALFFSMAFIIIYWTLPICKLPEGNKDLCVCSLCILPYRTVLGT